MAKPNIIELVSATPAKKPAVPKMPPVKKRSNPFSMKRKLKQHDKIWQEQQKRAKQAK